MSEQKTSHKVKGTGIGQKEAETRDMIVWRHVSWKDYKTFSRFEGSEEHFGFHDS